MTIDEFKKKYESEIPMYKAWAEYIIEKIHQELMSCLPNSALQIGPHYRIKEIDSIITKAYITHKNVDGTPRTYDSITDKVGMRYVFLLVDHMKILEKIIESCDLWEFSKDKDLDEWQKNNQTDRFGYQSVHYILRPKQEIQYTKTIEYNGQPHENIVIQKGIPCEVQIRTLLQHAYAEMSHTNVYKNDQQKIPNSVLRSLAKSGALIETTDEILSSAYKEIEEENAFLIEWKDITQKIAKQILKSPITSATDYIFASLREILQNETGIITQYKDYFNEKENSYIVQFIQDKQDIYEFQQETIFLIIFLIATKTRKFKRLYKNKELYTFDIGRVIEPIFILLGESLNDHL